MRSSAKKFRRLQSSSGISSSSFLSSNTTGDSLRRFKTDQLEQIVKVQVESHVLSNLVLNAKQIDELFFTDFRFSQSPTNSSIREIIELISTFFDQYLSSSVLLRCYIYLHVPSTESINDRGVNIQLQILKEIQEMENVIETNEILFTDFFKKHFELMKTLKKYPLIDDYQIFLNEFERKMFDDLRLICLELRTIFLKTYDLMMKNWTKIQQPTNDQHLLMID